MRLHLRATSTERRKKARKSLKTLEKIGVTWYNVCKQIRKF